MHHRDVVVPRLFVRELSSAGLAFSRIVDGADEGLGRVFLRHMGIQILLVREGKSATAFLEADGAGELVALDVLLVDFLVEGRLEVAVRILGTTVDEVVVVVLVVVC